MNYFTSDWHLNHERSLRFSARTHFSTHKECESLILQNIYDTLKKGDQLYFLGDLMWKAKKEELDTLFNPFKKKGISFHWILGNHDTIPLGYIHKALVSRGESKTVKEAEKKIFLSHFPYLCWNSSHYGAWNLHGHIHKGDSTHQKGFDKRSLEIGQQLNVNVEFHNWMPWSFEEVQEVMRVRNHNWDFIEHNRNGEDDV